MKEKPIVILCPMNCECDVLISELKLEKTNQIAGYTFYEGELCGKSAVVARCLIGTINSAACTLLAIREYDPCCIILQGTAGAHNPDLSKNDIVVAKKVVPITAFISKRRKIGEGINPFEWEIFGAESFNKETGKTDIVKELYYDKSLVKAALSIENDCGKTVEGVIASGDVWNREADLILHHRKEKNTDCEAMEGFGVAQVCAAFGVKMLELRVISNCELKERESFTTDTAKNIQNFTLKLVKTLEI